MNTPNFQETSRRAKAMLNTAALQAAGHLRNSQSLPALCTLLEAEKLCGRYPHLKQKIGDEPVVVIPEPLSEEETADMEMFLSSLLLPGDPDGVMLSHTITVRDPNTREDSPAVLHTAVWRGGHTLALVETTGADGQPVIKDGSGIEPVIAEALHGALGG